MCKIVSRPDHYHQKKIMMNSCQGWIKRWPSLREMGYRLRKWEMGRKRSMVYWQNSWHGAVFPDAKFVQISFTAHKGIFPFILYEMNADLSPNEIFFGGWGGGSTEQSIQSLCLNQYQKHITTTTKPQPFRKQQYNASFRNILSMY